MARCTASSGCSLGAIVSSRYSLIALDSNSDTLSLTRSTGTFLCGEMARNQSGRLSGSMWRNSNGVFFSRSTIAERCTHGQVLKLTSRYFAMLFLAVMVCAANSGCGLVLGVVVQLKLHIIRVAEENLATGTVRHQVNAVRNALAREMLLHRLEAAAAERNM